MPRHPTTAAVPAEPDLDQAKIATATQVMRADALADAANATQHEVTVRAVAASIGYQLPADCIDADLIQRDISANMRRSVEACLEVGRGLAVLKAACGHGNFMARLDVLGMDVHVAGRFMRAAAKFSKSPSTATLRAIGNQTKLFELLVLDDDQVEELELTGQTGELTLDDVSSMSVKELRAAVRELRADGESQAELLTSKNKAIDDLRGKLRRVAKEPPAEALAALHKEAAEHTAEALGLLRGTFRNALLALSHAGDERGSQAVVMAGMVGQLGAVLADLREEFGLPDVSDAATQELAGQVAQWGGK